MKVSGTCRNDRLTCLERVSAVAGPVLRVGQQEETETVSYTVTLL
jgi:hypothetical protein